MSLSLVIRWESPKDHLILLPYRAAMMTNYHEVRIASVLTNFAAWRPFVQFSLKMDKCL